MLRLLFGQILGCGVLKTYGRTPGGTDSASSVAPTSFPGPFPQARVKALGTRLPVAHALYVEALSPCGDL